MSAYGTSSDEKICIGRARRTLKPHLTSRSLKSGESLFARGAMPEAVYFLRSGVVQLQRPGLETPAFCVARSGDVIGVTYAISGRPYDMDAIATKASRVEVVERDTFIRLMTETPGLHLEVVRMLSVDLGRCYEVLRSLGPKTRNRTAGEARL